MNAFMQINLIDMNVQLRVRANYDYRAQHDDELSFCKAAIIVNVQKQDGGW